MEEAGINFRKRASNSPLLLALVARDVNPLMPIMVQGPRFALA